MTNKANMVLQVEDDTTGQVHVMNLSMHNAQKLYRALGEFIGDVQYQASPGQLITVPPVKFKI